MDNSRPRSNLKRSLCDSWDLFFAAPVWTIALAALVWAVTATLQWRSFGPVMAALASLGWTAAGTVIVFAGLFLFHFLYLTPKRTIRELQTQVEQATRDNNQEQTRNEVCLKLSRALGAGNAILDKCRQHITVTNEEAQEWASNAEFGVRLAAGEVWSIRFNDISGIPPASPPFPSDEALRRFLAQSIDVFNYVYPRCYRLRELIDAIDSGRVPPFSKPFGA